MVNDWTFGTLIEWIKGEFKRIEAILSERAEAVKVAFNGFEERLKTTNEWRRAFDDLTKTMASQEALGAIEKRVKRLEDAGIKGEAKTEGISQTTAAIVMIIGLIGTVSGIIAVIIALS